MKIISPSASFIQFSAIPARPNLLQNDFALRECNRFNVAFQVAIRNDDDSLIPVSADTIFKVGIANLICQLQEEFVQDLVPLCYRTYVDSFADTIHLTKIFYADIIKDYDQDVTFAELRDILLNDFGITLIQDGDAYYLHECCVTLFKIQYTTDGVLYLPITRYYDRFFANIDQPMNGAIAIDSCYKYCIFQDGDDELHCSNAFKRVFSPQFFTKVKYRCTEDSFDFEYNESDALFNLITLPLYIGRTQYPATRKAYKKSDGTNVILSAVLDKQPELFVDYMPEFFHDCLNAALNHDEFYLYENSAFVAYVLDDTYKVDWANEYTDWGLGNTKLKRRVYSYRNDNCKLANDCCLPPYVVYNLDTETNVLSFSIYTSIKTTLLQLRYREIGTEEWNVVEINEIDVPITAYTIDLDTLGYEDGFEFQWRQQCTGFSNWTTLVQIGGSDCVELNIAAFDFPDATLGQLYHVAIPFTGSLPVDLNDVVKPDWATVTVVDSTIVIDGTPDDTGTVEITGTMSNACNELPFDFSFDVLNAVHWVDPTNLVEDADNIEEDANLVGPPGASVTVKITTYTNSNGGNLYVDTSLSFLNNTFVKVLDGSGNASLHILYDGDATHHGSAMLVRFTIIAVTGGVIGSPDVFQTSKAYI